MLSGPGAAMRIPRRPLEALPDHFDGLVDGVTGAQVIPGRGHGRRTLRAERGAFGNEGFRVHTEWHAVVAGRSVTGRRIRHWRSRDLEQPARDRRYLHGAAS